MTIYTVHSTLVAKDTNLRNMDERKGIKPEEVRYGLRAALKHYNEPCASCNKVPVSIKPTVI